MRVEDEKGTKDILLWMLNDIERAFRRIPGPEGGFANTVDG